MDGTLQVLYLWYLIFEKVQCLDFTKCNIYLFKYLYLLNDT